jgi:transposase
MVGRHICDELKELALSLSLQGFSDSEVHQFTGISKRSVKHLRSTHRKTGAVSRKAITTGRPRTLTSMHRQFLCDCIERQPDSVLAELQTELREVCGVEVSIQTVSRSLQREGYTMKMITRPALERNELDRATFRDIVNAHYRPEQLVFADESHFNRLTMRRPYAWSKRGERASQYEFQFRGAKYSILPAISIDGIIHLEVLDNAVTGADFRRFVQDLLPRMNEWPLPNSVLVIDNASIHKVAGIREMVEGRGTAACQSGSPE